MSPRCDGLRKWADDQNPDFIALIAAASHAAEALRLGDEAKSASADQLVAATAAERSRLESDPCPDPDMADRLNGLVERYGLLAQALEAAPNKPDYADAAALGHQLWVLIADFSVFLSDLQQAIERQ